MKIVGANELRKGVDHTYIQHITLKESITSKFVEYLKTIGDVDYYISFPRVFFKVNIKNRYTINGTINNSVLEVVYLDKDYVKCIEELEKILLDYNCEYLDHEVS